MATDSKKKSQTAGKKTFYEEIPNKETEAEASRGENLEVMKFRKGC